MVPKDCGTAAVCAVRESVTSAAGAAACAYSEAVTMSYYCIHTAAYYCIDTACADSEAVTPCTRFHDLIYIIFDWYCAIGVGEDLTHMQARSPLTVYDLTVLLVVGPHRT